MSMNPPAPEAPRTQQIARSAVRLADRYSPVVLAVGGIVLGFILGRV